MDLGYMALGNQGLDQGSEVVQKKFKLQLPLVESALFKLNSWWSTNE